MQSQLILNYAIQFVVSAFVFLLVFDFVNGLLEQVRAAYIASSINILPCSPEPKTVFEAVADPWIFEIESSASLIQTNNIVECQLLLPPAKETPVLVQVEMEVKAIAWNQLKRMALDYKLSAKGKRSLVEQRLIEFSQTRDEVQLVTMLQYMKQLQSA